MITVFVGCLALVATPMSNRSIAIWTRAESGNAPVKTTVDLSILESQERTIDDVQYRQQQRYRGVSLAAILGAQPPPAGTDLAILHFHNGMRIGVHPRKADELAKLDAFVALDIWRAASEDTPEGWSHDFPTVSKHVAPGRDARPLTFTGNKLVLGTGWHPRVPGDGKHGFSPWLYTDTLTGIEYANEAAYERQFRLVGGGDEVGYGVFARTCAFCHGIEHVGASYGWDFSEPVSVTEYRGAKSLAMHVKYREANAPERGLMMPAFPDLKDSALKAVWDWMSKLSKQKTQPYTP